MDNKTPQIVLFSDAVSPGLGRYAGAYRIATELRDNGYTVQVIDFYTNFTVDQLTKIIHKFINESTLFVGFSTTLTSIMPGGGFYDSEPPEQLASYPPIQAESGRGYPFGRPDYIYMLETIKEVAPNTKIVLGGKNAGKVASHIHIAPFIDYVVIGQGETSVIEIAREIEANTIITSGGYRVFDEKNYPVLDYNTPNKFRIRFDESDQIFADEALPMEIARGCIFKCSFCSYDLNGKKLHEFNRDPQTIMDDLIEANQKFGVTKWLFADDTYNDSSTKVELLHRHITALPFDIQFAVYLRHDILINSMLTTATLLAESGLIGAMFGIETLNHAAGRSIGKGMKPETTKQGLNDLRKMPGWSDINMASGFIIGLPYESINDLRNTLEWLMSDDCPLDGWRAAALKLNSDSTLLNIPNFKYERIDGGRWKSDLMNSDDANNIQQEFTDASYERALKMPLANTQYARTATNNMNHDDVMVGGSPMFVTRFMNLGFSLNEIRNGGLVPHLANTRKLERVTEYYLKLIR